jgi:3-deoxy-7-phosphoheptulonate synthase
MTQSIFDVNIKKTLSLITPHQLMEDLPITQKATETVHQGRQAITSILQGADPRALVIVGPCSIHDEKAGLEYAQRLADLAHRLSDRILVVMRVYFEKPRTTLGWKGLIYDPMLDGSFDIESGLHRARGFLLSLGEIGLPAATEFLDPIVPQYLADLISWAAVGARTVESQTHRQMASGLSMPVGFKNSTDGSPQNAVDAIVTARSPHAFLGIDRDGNTAVVLTKGNPNTHLVLRGGKGGANFDASTVAEIQTLLQSANLPSQIMVDCSHANSDKDHTRQYIVFRDVIKQRLAGNTDIIGCMVESHIHPGNQKLGSDPSKLEYGVSITDACIGWEETEMLLGEAHEQLGALAVT